VNCKVDIIIIKHHYAKPSIFAMNAINIAHLLSTLKLSIKFFNKYFMVVFYKHTHTHTHKNNPDHLPSFAQCPSQT